MTDTSNVLPNILIVDDNKDIRTALADALSSQGYNVEAFDLATSALAALTNSVKNLSGEEVNKFDLIISDVCMPQMDGLEFVTQVKNNHIDIPIILMTAFGELDTAIKAIRLGAFDFLKKPFDISELLLSVERALGHYHLIKENKALSDEIETKWKLDQIVGKSQKMANIFEVIKRVSRTNAGVLILGESGSGKEVIARAIHQNSLNSEKPFVAVNCAAIPTELLESELFGHAKGAFTGAIASRKGLFQEADGGTLFLDEIGDMSMALQAKLLRVLQDRMIKPVGDNQSQQVDVRIIAATHRDLKLAIKQDKFREDLYFRLNVISIHVPALRERPEDISLLAQYFLKKFAAIHHVRIKGFSKSAMTYLTSRTWPGNIRELENAIERAVILCDTQEIQERDLIAEEGTAKYADGRAENGEYLSLRDMERKYICHILKRTGGKKERAARILAIDRTTLYRKLNDYGLEFNAADDDFAGAEALFN